jgi:hypothetical protein
MGSPLPLRDLAAHLKTELDDDRSWSAYLRQAHQLHLAVLVDPYLDYILEGRKTVESRFGITRGLPFGRIRRGDLIVLKRSAGPVVGIARVSKSESMSLSEDTWLRLRALTKQICADEQFWRERRDKRFATIAFIDRVRSLTALSVEKTDRRGWVILPQEKNLEALWSA